MNCHECQDLLHRRLDGDVTAPTRELEQHFAQCPGCRALHASAQVLVEGLKILPAPALPLDFTQRMTGLVLEDRRVRLAHFRRRWTLTVPLAASVLVMAVAGYFLLPVPRNIDPPTNQIAAKEKQEVPQQGPVEKPVESPHLAKSVDDARHAVVSLSERWAEKAREQTKIFLTAANPIEIPDIDSFPDGAEPLELEPAAQSLRQVGQGVAEGLQPVAQVARRAFAYFVRELPVLPGKP